MKRSIRRNTPTVQIGKVRMGGGSPIVVQSMTNTETADVHATVAQIKELVDAGSELVRVTVNDEAAMKAIPRISTSLNEQGYNTPIIGDFHYNGHILLSKYPESAKQLAKYRINPGNVGKGNKRDQNFETMIKIAIEHNKVVRIGVNAGSLDQEILKDKMDENAKKNNPEDFKNVLYQAMVQSALESARLAESIGLPKTKIVISVKMSEVQDMIEVYQQLAQRCDYVLHLGLTEAGGGVKGIVSSSAALAILLQQGIGDTIRVSLTPEPGVNRDLEVKNCRYLLQSLGLRYFMPLVTSCPGCGRTKSDRFIHLAKDINNYIEETMPTWKQRYPGVEKLNIAVMGCIVNGPGESKYADIGISFPGTAEEPKIPIYQDGKRVALLEQSHKIKEEFIHILETYIHNRFKTIEST